LGHADSALRDWNNSEIGEPRRISLACNRDLHFPKNSLWHKQLGHIDGGQKGVKRAEHVDLVWLGPDSWSHGRAELELGPEMNQSELIEKVAQATELNQVVAGQAVKAVQTPFSMPSWPARRSVSPDLGSSRWRRGLHARGEIHKPERPSKSQPARQCGSTQARPSKMSSIRQLRRRLPGRRLHHQRNPQ
jgi:hypothetical protein